MGIPMQEDCVDRLFAVTNHQQGDCRSGEVLAAHVILQGILRLDALDWCNYAFHHDPLDSKLSPAIRRELMVEADACGRSHAKGYEIRYQTSDPVSLAQAMGLRVHPLDAAQSCRRLVYAEYAPPHDLYINWDAVEKGAETCRDPTISGMLGGQPDLARVLLAHEIFHCIEEENKTSIFTKTYRFKLWQAGPFQYRTPLAALSEIAAMAFARELLRLPFSPYVLDAILMYADRPGEATELYHQMLQCAGKMQH